MSIWNRKGVDSSTRTAPDTSADTSNPENDSTDAESQPHVAGERGLPPLKPFRSVQSRVSALLTASLMIALAAGLLIYYYSHALNRGSEARSQAQSRQSKRAQGESILPPLSSFHLPAPPSRTTFNSSDTAQTASSPPTASPDSIVDRVLGGAPPLPTSGPEIPSQGSNPYAGIGTASSPPLKSPAQLAMERRLGGPTLVHTSIQEQSGSTVSSFAGLTTPVGSLSGGAQPIPQVPNSAEHEESPGGVGQSLDSYLRPTAIPTAVARVLPTQRLLLPKGAFVDCTLETAISSSLPGMTTCITATDTFSVDGSVVLLERGSKLVGETRGGVHAGSPRLFVLWTEARTPAGIVIPLESPGTDELGRSGLPGTVDWHWWQRFGSALLISVIDGVVQGLTQKDSTTVQLNPSGASDVVANIVRDSANIPPTVDKNQGDRIEVFVARDVDFRSVFALEARANGLR
jgi:type IV secretion system protein VirB10